MRYPYSLLASTAAAMLAVNALGAAFVRAQGSSDAKQPKVQAAGVNSAQETKLVPSSGERSLLVSDDLELDLVLQEPTIAKPLYMTFDQRGRLWVVEYRQYPSPAGLKLLSRDSVWRNVYDPPFPPPPPHAADSPYRGQDRISIHEDADGDGSLETTTTFLEGLNLATAALPGRGGVFVLNPPYLLFYADSDRDDRPDSPQPKVLLSGFGIEDSHSIANSLRWGPDGWIYATQGSTVSSSVVTHDEADRPPTDQPAVHSMGQNVWRYHPERRRYEIYAEGGGNAFGIEIDRHGHIYSGHNGGDTRGFHYIQGGYWQKNFGKHGQLSNPYAFDFHAAMRHPPVERFTHTFCIYDATDLPGRYHGALFGINPIEHHIALSSVQPDGSSRRTTDRGYVAHSGEGERADWFTPVDIQLGPDGALYIADWYAEQANHFRNHEGKTNPGLGRIYRLRGHEHKLMPAFDLAEMSSQALVDRYLFHPNRWFRQQTRRVLADRRDASIVPALWQLVEERTHEDALEAFWALDASGGLDASRIPQCLAHDNPHVRRWCVHLLGDNPADAMQWQSELEEMARREPDVEVRCQLAATAKRLPAELAVPLIFTLLDREQDAEDIYLPKTLWWSLEAHASDVAGIAKYLSEPGRWDSPFRVAGYSLAQNLMRRYALAGRQHDLENCARLLQLAPNDEHRNRLVEAFVASHAGRTLPTLPPSLESELAKGSGPFAELLAIRRQEQDAIIAAHRSLEDSETPDDHRIALIQALGDVQAEPAATIAVLTDVLSSDREPPVKNAALLALQRFSSGDIAGSLIKAWPLLPAASQAVAAQVLSSRQTWALALLQAVQDERISKDVIDAEAVGRLRRYPDESLKRHVEELFPTSGVTLSDREARIESLADTIRQGQGSPLNGQALFHGKATCGKCHRLFTHGGEIGPDLTPYNRTDLTRILLALVHPSAEIREGYEGFTVLTDDGLILSGFKIDETDRLVVIRGTDGENQTILKSQIEAIVPNETSLMPEGLLDGLTEDEVRDLFAYLSSTTPPM